MGTNLKDVAQDWFNQEVEQFHRIRKTWTFEDLVCEMYKRFINEATAQKAAGSFDRTEYSRKKGVIAFVNDLERKAARMVQRPDEYTFKRRFLDGLPDEVGEEILRVHGVSAEHSTLDEMIEATRKVENAQQYTEARRKERSRGNNTNAKDKPSHSNVATGTKKPEQIDGNAKTFRLFKRAGDYATGATGQANFRRPFQNQRNPGYYQPQGNAGKKEGEVGNRYQQTPYKANADTKPPWKNENKPAWKNNNPTPRVFAAHVIDEEKEENPPDSEESAAQLQETEDQPDALTDPESHESEKADSIAGEEYYLEEYEGSNSGDDSDVVYLRAMNAGTDTTLAVPPRWTYDPRLGVIHPEGTCTPCNHYRSHRKDAQGGHDLSHNIAQIVPHHIQNEVYERGWNDGQTDIIPPLWSTSELPGRPTVVTLNTARRQLEQQIREHVMDMTLNATEVERVGRLFHELGDQLELMKGRAPEDATDSYEDLTSQLKFLRYRFSAEAERYRASCEWLQARYPVLTEDRYWIEGNVLETPRVQAMNDHTEPTRAFRYALRKPDQTGDRPARDPKSVQCMAIYVNLNGFPAWTLLDTGSTTDSVSPQVAQVAKLPYFQLNNPVTLQLGCVGSRSQINYGVDLQLKVGPVEQDYYLDVANIDRYDCILGTPFLRAFGVHMNFEDGTVQIRGKKIPAVPVEAESEILRSRRGPGKERRE
jgi:hypothetical protein